MIAEPWGHIINDDLTDFEMPTTITDTAPIAPRIQAPENTTAVPLHQLNVAVLGQD
eukprot:gene19950-14530_t